MANTAGSAGEPPSEPTHRGNNEAFASRIIVWQKQHGRHDLPWQNTRDPYAIWVSEIMLQQTQVGAVIPYYQRFMARFPTLESLAAAEQETVLQHWSGLGYYARARNLHKAARLIHAAGRFPQTIADIQALPGIGRSTAAAIAAFAFGQRAAILDGNVKRVLARYFGIEGWPGHPKVEQSLWGLATDLLPSQEIEAYTQGLMDLGASLCRRSNPLCAACPLQKECIACLQQRTRHLPSPKPRKALPEREIHMLLIFSGQDILLEKRPNQGIWGGLWSLPEGPLDQPPEAIATKLGLTARPLPPLPTLTHSFTHFRLHIHPCPMITPTPQTPPASMLWMPLEDAIGAALPAPVHKLLSSLKAQP